jgi:hypothetical protein
MTASCVCSLTIGATRMTYVPLVPSVFGRDLVEQVRADSRDGERMVPIVVEKCIDAVEALGMLFKLFYKCLH